MTSIKAATYFRCDFKIYLHNNYNHGIPRVQVTHAVIATAVLNSSLLRLKICPLTLRNFREADISPPLSGKPTVRIPGML